MARSNPPPDQRLREAFRAWEANRSDRQAFDAYVQARVRVGLSPDVEFDVAAARGLDKIWPRFKSGPRRGQPKSKLTGDASAAVLYQYFRDRGWLPKLAAWRSLGEDAPVVPDTHEQIIRAGELPAFAPIMPRGFPAERDPNWQPIPFGALISPEFNRFVVIPTGRTRDLRFGVWRGDRWSHFDHSLPGKSAPWWTTHPWDDHAGEGRLEYDSDKWGVARRAFDRSQRALHPMAPNPPWLNKVLRWTAAGAVADVIAGPISDKAEAAIMGVARGVSNNPSADARLQESFRTWERDRGDQGALKRFMSERERSGHSVRSPYSDWYAATPQGKHPPLTPPWTRGLSKWIMLEPERVEAVIAAAPEKKREPTAKGRRLKGPEAAAIVEAWLSAQGWRRDHHPSSTLYVWISPDAGQRVTFKRSALRFESGGRGKWRADPDMQPYERILGTIDFAEYLLARAKRHLHPAAPNPGGRDQALLSLIHELRQENYGDPELWNALIHRARQSGLVVALRSTGARGILPVAADSIVTGPWSSHVILRGVKSAHSSPKAPEDPWLMYADAYSGSTGAEPLWRIAYWFREGAVRLTIERAQAANPPRGSRDQVLGRLFRELTASGFADSRLWGELVSKTQGTGVAIVLRPTSPMWGLEAWNMPNGPVENSPAVAVTGLYEGDPKKGQLRGFLWLRHVDAQTGNPGSTTLNRVVWLLTSGHLTAALESVSPPVVEPNPPYEGWPVFMDWLPAEAHRRLDQFPKKQRQNLTSRLAQFWASEGRYQDPELVPELPEWWHEVASGNVRPLRRRFRGPHDRFGGL